MNKAEELIDKTFNFKSDNAQLKRIVSKQKMLALEAAHPDNLKILKERFYHFLQCTCGIDFAIQQTNTFKEALNLMRAKWGKV